MELDDLFHFLSGKKDSIQQKLFLVDVRTPDEFAEGSVEGAVNIPLDLLTQEIAQFENKENIVVFCRSGARSEKAKLMLEGFGFHNLINGGAWTYVQSKKTEILKQD